MNRPSIFAKIFLSLMLLALALQILLALYLGIQHRRFVAAEQRQHLETLARLLAPQVEARLADASPGELQQVCNAFDRTTGLRVTILDAQGAALADSRRAITAMESHRGRPEVMEALAGRTGSATRFSTSTRTHTLYVAAPLRAADGAPAVLRLAVTARTLQSILAPLQQRLIAGSAVLVILAAIISYVVSRAISRPIQDLQRTARALARGETAVSWPEASTRETAELGAALRDMANHLQDRLSTIEVLLEEQRAMFDHMADGLLLVDQHERVLDLNRAAAHMLAVAADQVRGRALVEVVRNGRLHELVRDALAADAPVVGDLAMHGSRPTHLQVHGTRIRAGARLSGALLVLTDVTRLRELENIRRDFVANASHELKTPITAIKGFAETLADPDIEPEQARRFAKTIARQSDQLSALVEDLLELTRLEHAQEHGTLHRELTPLAEVLHSAVERCSDKAAQKEIRLLIEDPGALSAPLDPALIQRALVNLIDNAINYSEPKTEVRIGAQREGNAVWLSVRDQGVGIRPEHLPRIFERFYRVDKSRSRKLGGTGLGLAIVKHAAQSHGGDVTVESTPGQGSTFTLILPLDVAQA